MSLWEFMAHLGVAMLCGLVLGVERQWRQHPVGLRTNALICIGAALFVSISAMVAGDAGPTRITSQVVTGIGFLGGGAILRDGLNVKGLTTAATIWCSAAVGALCGFGFLAHAAIGTAVILFINFGLHPVSDWFNRFSNEQQADQPSRYRLTVSCSAKELSASRLLLMQQLKDCPKLTLHAVEKRIDPDQTGAQLIAECRTPQSADDALAELVTRLQLDGGLAGIRWERLEADPSGPR